MSIEGWADTARHDRYRQGSEHQRAIDTIKDMLQGKLDADSAADAIASIYNPLLKRAFKISPVVTLWGVICDAARVLGGDRDISERMVSLLDSISKLSDVTDDYGNVVTPVRGVYWRDLPELAITYREYGIDIEPLDEMEEGEWDAQAVTLINATTFGAIYLARGRQPVGMSFHAEVSLMQGIEVPYQTREQQRCAAVYVPPAATWVLLAGEKIYELCKADHDRKDSDPASNLGSDQWLWAKSRGYSLGRWAFWKKRFGDIAATSELKDGVKEIAERAASRMESIDG